MENNIIEVKSDSLFLLECLDPWDYQSNQRRYKNYLAIVTRNDDNGEFIFNFLKESREKDEYFNISQVKENDILVAIYKDYYKGRSVKIYYKVLKKLDDKLVLGRDTTYRKAQSIGIKE